MLAHMNSELADNGIHLEPNTTGCDAFKQDWAIDLKACTDP